MEPIDYRGALARGWRLLVILGIVGLAIGLLLPTSTKTPEWTSTSSVGAIPAPTGNDGSSSLAPGVTTDQILFYATSDKVIIKAGRLAEAHEPLYVLRSWLTVTGPGTNASGSASGQAGIVSVSVKAPNEFKALFFNHYFTVALGEALQAEAVAQLQGQKTQVAQSIALIGGVLGTVNAQAGVEGTALETELTALETRQAQLAVTAPYTGYTVLSDASTPYQGTPPPIQSRPIRGLIGLLIGVIVGALIALVATVLDKRIRSAPQAESAFGYPVIAEIPEVGGSTVEPYRMLWLAVFRQPLARRAEPDAAWAESDDLSNERLDLPVPAWGNGPRAMPVPAIDLSSLAEPSQRQVVLIVSPGDEPTRASVAANLAKASAEAGQEVAVISTNSILAHEDLPYGTISTPTASDVSALLEDTNIPHVSILPLENVVSHSSYLVPMAPAIIGALRDLVDVVIIEVPPLLTVHHGEGLIPLVDVVVGVGECRWTTTKQLRKTRMVMKRLGAPVAGLALTNVPLPFERPRRGTDRDKSTTEDVEARSAVAVLPSVALNGHGPESDETVFAASGAPRDGDADGEGDLPEHPGD
jgi:capsular polysaccharide biosynthesis protein/Mrp family chromosome partitioning ATPase